MEDSERIARMEQAIHKLTEGVGELAEEISTKLQFLGSELDATQGALTDIRNGRDPGALPEVTESKDVLWTCPNCYTRLGHYSPDEDVIRVKVKDSYMAFKAGVGGWLTVICRSCGRPVTAADESKAGATGGTASGPA